MMKLSKWVMVAVVLAVSTTAICADQSELSALKARIEKLEAQQDAAMDRQEIMQAIQEMAADAPCDTMPTWLENLEWGGDLRLRYQWQSVSNQPVGNNTHNRARARFRLRTWIKKFWLDRQMEVGFRLASGDAAAATSTNQTMTGLFNKKTIWIDRAYAKYTPAWIKDTGLELTIAAGKVANPLIKTGLTWDSDVNPEGVYAHAKYPVGPVTPFGSIAYFIVNENNAIGNNEDAIVWVYQAGMTWEVVEDVKWTFAAALYDWNNAVGSLNGNNTSASLDEMTNVNLYTDVKFKVMDLPVKMWMDWVQACDQTEQRDFAAAVRTYNEDQRCGLEFGAKVGQNKAQGDWSASGLYRRVQANAWWGNLNDGDFDGTNREGFQIGGKYNITDFLTAGATYFWTWPYRDTDPEERRCILQFDLAWTF